MNPKKGAMAIARMNHSKNHTTQKREIVFALLAILNMSKTQPLALAHRVVLVGSVWMAPHAQNPNAKLFGKSTMQPPIPAWPKFMISLRIQFCP